MQKSTMEQKLLEIRKITKRNHLYTVLVILITLWLFLCLLVTTEKAFHFLLNTEEAVKYRSKLAFAVLDAAKKKVDISQDFLVHFNNYSKPKRIKRPADYEDEIKASIKEWTDVIKRMEDYTNNELGN